MTNTNIFNEKLEALRKREASLKAAISKELLRQQKRKEREDERLHSIVGAMLVRNARSHTDFELLVKNVLRQNSMSLGKPDVTFLARKGWL